MEYLWNNGISMEYLWNNGISMEYLWNIYGISMGYLWNIYGISMEYLWNIYGISMEYLWDIYGISMGYLWNIYGISMEYLWNIYGISMEYLWDMEYFLVFAAKIPVCWWNPNFRSLLGAGEWRWAPAWPRWLSPCWAGPWRRRRWPLQNLVPNRRSKDVFHLRYAKIC